MAGIDVDRTDLEGLLGASVSEARFTAIDKATRKLIRSGFRGDIDSAEGRMADALGNVYTDVFIRLFTNPTGASNFSVGAASAGFGSGGIAVSLTDSERRDLAALTPTRRRPTYVHLRREYEAAPVITAPVVLILPEEDYLP